MAIEFDVNAPLELCEGEPLKAHEHLRMYYNMGANRSLDKLSRMDGCEVGRRQLQNYSADFSWQDRIKAQYVLDAETIQSELLELRLQNLKEFGFLLVDAIRNADTEGANISQISTALRAFIDGYATVFDALPTRKTQITQVSDLSFESILQELANKENE